LGTPNGAIRKTSYRPLRNFIITEIFFRLRDNPCLRFLTKDVFSLSMPEATTLNSVRIGGACGCEIFVDFLSEKAV